METTPVNRNRLLGCLLAFSTSKRALSDRLQVHLDVTNRLVKSLENLWCILLSRLSVYETFRLSTF